MFMMIKIKKNKIKNCIVRYFLLKPICIVDSFISEIIMTTKIAINGFGRIGRLVLRAIAESGRTDIQVVGINDLAPLETNAHLLRYDSVHGRFPGTVTTDDGYMIVNGHKIRVTAIRDPKELPWGDLDVDVAMECTMGGTRSRGTQVFCEGLNGSATG